jgi:alpha-tubulin suppressor-like RCC1 family protein
MTLDVANGASIGVHYATLYATGCLGPVVAKQAIALDVRPAGLPNRLTVEVFGGGVVASTNVTGIDCGIDCEEDYALNAQVILTATAVPGAMFTGWTGDCQASPNQPDQASFPMDKDRTCHATFTLQPVSTTNAHIVAGHFYSVARKSGGAALSWGIDSGEELGNGPGNASRNAPGPIAVIGDAIALGGLYGGNGNGFVVRASGEVWGWGGDAFGQLGDGVTSAVPNGTPLAMTDTSGAVVTNATAVASGAGHTVVLLANGDVLAVGVNSSGELGDGSPSGPRPRAAAVTGLTNVRAIGAGSHFSMALRTDGTVWTWGANNQGQLGDPAVASRPLPGQVAGLANIVAIAAGAEFALALDANGDVWAWGANGNGELGDASGVANRAAPGRVSLAGATAIAAGQNHAFAIKGGALYGWGRNASAQLGLGDTQPRAAPVAIGGIGNVVEVAGGNSHSLAVDANGDVWAWGSNGSGELGIGTGQLSAPTPVRVPGLNVN